ncbi:hypothetical protein HELRODRAFT_179696 [Helobdella robusta]|uniref:Protein phosphatase 1 regulatory subunit 7 n=1 Tax=Helobdella robusta TaxID=6412 RepID=T1FF15_HELRO|nr:hypothetical protein HELRODRAFT_179696 [Helobdella robusta]ESN95107.1 hypothetical protein HELRODRAFT_179696 [Helobdella robusta]
MCGFDYFPNLQSLCIVGQSIDKIENISSLFKLKELWIVECCVKEICGLGSLLSLQKLYLYSNKISKMQNLQSLKSLRVLALNDNPISKIQGLKELTNLIELNLADCEIERIGSSLSHLINLDTLDLSGNPLFLLDDIKNLKTLTNLRHLSLKSKIHRKCCLTDLPNYNFYVIHHVTNLLTLDGEDVTNSVVKLSSTNMVNRKLVYYTMKRKACDKNYYKTLRCISQASDNKLKFIYDRLRQLNLFLCVKPDEENVNRVKPLIEKYHQLVRKYAACKDLVQSRFCSLDYARQSYDSIAVTKVTKVENGSLTYKFHHSIGQKCSGSDVSYWPPTRQLAYKKDLEYLFYVWEDGDDVSSELMTIVKDGVTRRRKKKMSGRRNNAKMTMTDKNNSAKNSSAKNSSAKNSPIKIPANDTKVTEMTTKMKERGDSNDALKNAGYGNDLRSAGYDNDRSSVGDRYDNDYVVYGDVIVIIISIRRAEERKSSSSSSSSSLCDCAVKQREWFILKPEFVLLEYIIEFEYLTKDEKHGLSFEERIDAVFDKQVLQRLHQQPQQPQQPQQQLQQQRQQQIRLLDDDDIDDDSYIDTINRHHNKIANLDGLYMLSQLYEFYASNNLVTSLSGIKHGMTKMKMMTLQNNQLTNTYGDVMIIICKLQNITHLDISCNYWRKAHKMKETLTKKLKYLVELDNQPVVKNIPSAQTTDQSNNNVQRSNNQSKNVSSFADQSPATTDSGDQSNSSAVFDGQSHRRISLGCATEKPTTFRPITSQQTSITSVSYRNSIIFNLNNFKQFKHIVWANFDGNNLFTIQGLESCRNTLLELSLADNHLKSANQIALFTKLEKLCLDDNYISNFSNSTFQPITNLSHLSIINNQVKQLAVFSCLLNLMEFYASNNEVEDLREVFHLKKLQKLLILDLENNPLTRTSEQYRMFTIYHIRTIKILDSCYIEKPELLKAKEIYGGMLTRDFLMDQLDRMNVEDVRTLDFPISSIQSIDLGNPSQFNNLISINLENNNLTSFSGLIYLKSLKVEFSGVGTLCLNNNRIECVFEKSKFKQKTLNNMVVYNSTPYAVEVIQMTVLDSLEVLHLGYNGIKDLQNLQLNFIPSLRALFLQGNEIARVEGLYGCHKLEELVLDKNRIRSLDELSLVNQQRTMRELHVEENRLRSLNNFGRLFALQRLFLGLNQLQEIMEIEKLSTLVNLIEISLSQNNKLQIIDGVPITESDRSRAELFYNEQVQQFNSPLMNINEQSALASIYVNQSNRLLKINNMQLVEKSLGGVNVMTSEMVDYNNHE